MPDNTRSQVYGFGRSTAQKAVQANKKSPKYINNLVAKNSNSGIIKSKNYAKAVDVFTYTNIDTKISPQDIVDMLEQSEIGREALRQLKEKKCKPILDYSPKRVTHRGWQNGNNITLYMVNIPSVRVAAQTVIHEATHLYYNIGQSQWAEAVCFAREKMFLTGKPLTVSERKYVIKLAKDNYSYLKWKRGGYGHDKLIKLDGTITKWK